MALKNIEFTAEQAHKGREAMKLLYKLRMAMQAHNRLGSQMSKQNLDKTIKEVDLLIFDIKEKKLDKPQPHFKSLMEQWREGYLYK